MSDVATVAGSLGVPDEIIRRSAEARAAANGTSSDAILAAWGGGAPVAAPATAAPEPVAESEAAPEPEPEVEVAPAPQVPTIPGPPAEVPEVPAAAGEPPVLVDASDNPWAVLVGALGLFIAVVLLGLVGPAIPTENPGARSGEIALSADGGAGRTLYSSLGCGSCHTQMIRPLIADVGLGPVTLSDTNQVLGSRRFGPDLAEIGARMSGSQIEAIVRGSGGHPGQNLSDGNMSTLVAYLLESTTAGAGG